MVTSPEYSIVRSIRLLELIDAIIETYLSTINIPMSESIDLL